MPVTITLSTNFQSFQSTGDALQLVDDHIEKESEVGEKSEKTLQKLGDRYGDKDKLLRAVQELVPGSPGASQPWPYTTICLNNRIEHVSTHLFASWMAPLSS